MKDARPRCRTIAALMLLTASQTMAQERGLPASRPIPASARTALVALGEQLFHDTRLSGNLTLSCATCHRPDLAFTDGKRHAIGQNGASLGRNTPTLYGVSSVTAFPLGGSLEVLAENLTLNARVLAPLRSGAEMNESVEGAILHLSYDKAAAPKFDEVFAAVAPTDSESGVTPRRLATALTAYVASLCPPPSPGLFALQGQDASLPQSERRGLDVFRGSGRCTTCHSGHALTDGRSHVVATFRQQRQISAAVEEIDDERPTSRPNATIVAGGSVEIDVRPESDSPEARVFEVEFLPQGEMRPRYGSEVGNATFESIERQTTSLIDVCRTAPYFRDGSSASIDQAVRRHVRELREVGRDRNAIAANPDVLLAGITLMIRNRPRIALTDSAKAQLSSDSWVPAKLDETQLADLVSFLTSLSPAR